MMDGDSSPVKPIERGTQVFVADRKDKTKTHHEWYRGEHTNKAPNRARMVPTDAVNRYVLQGWMPKAPAITKDTKITAFGSCFAANISSWLGQRNYRVAAREEDAQKAYVVRIGEGMVNSFVIRQQFEWAWEGKTFDQPLWHGYDANAFGYDDEVRAQTRRLFDETEVFILTFGLSEVWYDEVTQEVFWRTIPKDAYDPERHKFRVSSVEENRDNIDAIYQMIRKHRPEAKVIMTLSPVPLIATFRDNSCVSSNAVSKAVLRVALDEVMRAHKEEGHLFYWPSYEMVMDTFGGPFKEDRRHLPRAVLDYIMIQFEHQWCHTDAGELPSLTEAWVKALATAGLLPARLATIVTKRSLDKLKDFAGRDNLNPDPDINAAQQKLLSELVQEWESAP